MRKLILLTSLFIFCFKTGHTQPGALDFSFGSKGIVRTDLGSNVTLPSIGKQVLLQSNGSMYVIFESAGTVLIAKKHIDGSPDSTYGHNGYSTSVVIDNAHAVLQKDGKIVMAGTVQADDCGGWNSSNYDFALARFNTNGSLDQSFGGSGTFTTDFTGHDDVANAVFIQSDGKIVVCGITGRYGEFDESNYEYPKLSDNIAIVRYNINGSLDNTFNGNGKSIIPLTPNWFTISSSAIQSDGKIIVAINDYYGFNLARINIDGSLDNTLKLTTNLKRSDDSYFVANTIAIQSDGKFVLGGVWENSNGVKDFVLARFNINGTIDNSFNKIGIQNTDFRGYDDIITEIAIQPDGKIVATGNGSNGYNNAFAISRYNKDGSLDNSFDSDGKKLTYITSNNIYAFSVAVSGQGKIITVGYEEATTNMNPTNIALIRYNSDGSLDNTFNLKGTLINHFLGGKKSKFSCSTVQTDGKILAAGNTWNGKNYDFVVVRFNTNGSLDNTFSSDGIQTMDFGSNDYAKSIAVQSDGKIVVVGGTYLLRYNINGSLDNTFSTDGKQKANFIISSLKLQKDNKILVAGGSALARYNTNGSFDFSFNGDGKVSTPVEVNDLAVQSDGKIVVIGGLTIARYTITGSLDNTFDGDGIRIKEITNNDEDSYYNSSGYNATSLSIQSDGKIVVGGDSLVWTKYTEDHFTVINRYNPDGSFDFSAAPFGFSANSYPTLIALQHDSKIVVSANLYEYGLDCSYHEYTKPIGFAIASV